MVKLSDMTPKERKEHYRQRAQKRLKNYSGTGGFGQGEAGKERAREAAKKSWEVRRAKQQAIDEKLKRLAELERGK